MPISTKPISLFGGSGFILSNYARLYPEGFVELRECFCPKYNDVLYGISTVDNYHPLKGDFHVDINTNLNHLMDVLPNVEGSFTFLSSWFVLNRAPGRICHWPAPAMHFDENDECWPKGMYAITKYCAERLIQTHCETVQAGLVKGSSSYRILRLCNVIGNDPKAGKQKNALEFLLRKIVNNEDVQIYEGDNFRNYLHVNDVCRAIHLCLDKPETLNGITNIGAPESVRLIDLISYAIQKTGSKSQITRIPVPAFHKIVQVPDFFMNTNKLQSLGFIPEMDAYQAVDAVLAGILDAARYKACIDEDISEADTYQGLTLSDRADMVKGHYCIMRQDPHHPAYVEYWTERGWAAFGEVFMSREEAVAARRKILASVNP